MPFARRPGDRRALAQRREPAAAELLDGGGELVLADAALVRGEQGVGDRAPVDEGDEAALRPRSGASARCEPSSSLGSAVSSAQETSSTPSGGLVSPTPPPPRPAPTRPSCPVGLKPRCAAKAMPGSLSLQHSAGSSACSSTRPQRPCAEAAAACRRQHADPQLAARDTPEADDVTVVRNPAARVLGEPQDRRLALDPERQHLADEREHRPRIVGLEGPDHAQEDRPPMPLASSECQRSPRRSSISPT